MGTEPLVSCFGVLSTMVPNLSWCSSREPSTISNSGHSEEFHGSECNGNISKQFCVGSWQCYLPHRASHAWFPRARAGSGHALASKLARYESPIGHVWDQMVCISVTWSTQLPIWLSCDRLSDKPGILWQWKVSSTWLMACPDMWLCCWLRVVATLNNKRCTRKNRS